MNREIPSVENPRIVILTDNWVCTNCGETSYNIPATIAVRDFHRAFMNSPTDDFIEMEVSGKCPSCDNQDEKQIVY